MDDAGCRSFYRRRRKKKNVCNLSRSHGNLAKRKRRSRETYIRRSLRVISKQVLQRSNLFEISTRDERTLFSPRSSLNVDPLSKERRERERERGGDNRVSPGIWENLLLSTRARNISSQRCTSRTLPASVADATKSQEIFIPLLPLRSASEFQRSFSSMAPPDSSVTRLQRKTIIVITINKNSFGEKY